MWQLLLVGALGGELLALPLLLGAVYVCGSSNINIACAAASDAGGRVDGNAAEDVENRKNLVFGVALEKRRGGWADKCGL